MKKLLFTLFLSTLFFPLLGQNQVDTRNSVVKFKANALWVAGVTGELKGMTGAVNWSTDETKCKIDVCLETNTLNSENQERDNHLKSKDFLDVENYPQVCFISNRIQKTENGEYVAWGQLSLHGVTKEVSIPLTYKDFILTGVFKIQRKDFNVGNDISKFTASNQIELEITCVLVP